MKIKSKSQNLIYEGQSLMWKHPFNQCHRVGRGNTQTPLSSAGEEQNQHPTKGYTGEMPSNYEMNSESGQQNKCQPQPQWCSEKLVRLYLSSQLDLSTFLKILSPIKLSPYMIFPPFLHTSSNHPYLSSVLLL